MFAAKQLLQILLSSKCVALILQCSISYPFHHCTKCIVQHSEVTTEVWCNGPSSK